MPSTRQQPGPAAAPESPAAIVVIAASAGGLAALTAVLSALPADFPVPVVVVQHLDARHDSLMAEILERRSSLRVEEASEGAKLAPATVYTAPPDHHVLVAVDGSLALSHAEKVHFVRPSADPLFESAAGAYPARAIAVVLSGTGSDGNLGVRAIHESGGTVIVQDPETAEFSGMPRAAIATGAANFVLDLDDIGPAVLALVNGTPAS